MFLDNLSASILRLCDEYELTYETASERCNLSSRYFGDIARGKTAPSIPTLEKICVGFDRTPNEMLLLQSTLQISSFRKPMAVTCVRLFHGAYGMDRYPVCPRCDTTMEREYQHFCDRCGQCIGWNTYRNAIVILPK